LASKFVLAALMLLPSITRGQTAAGDWSALRAVERGSKLSVTLKTGKTFKGRLGGVTDSALTLSIHDKATDFAREDVQSVYEIRGKSAKKATLIGAAVGGGIGAIVGVAGGDSGDGGFVIISKGQAAAALGALGAGAGALVGFAFGRGGGKRVLVYRAAP
jgi:hypothetical protein